MDRKQESTGGADRPITRASLKYFSPTGVLLTVVNLDEMGDPFGGVSYICESRGDTVLIAGTSVGVVDGTGRVIRRFPENMVGAPAFWDSACFDDGSVLMRVRDAGTQLDLSDPNPTMRFIARRTDGSLAHEFGVQPYTSFLPSGPHPSVIASGRSLIVAAARTSEVRVYDLTNRLTHIIRWADKPAPVTSVEIAANAGRGRASDENGPLTPPKFPYTPTWPAYQRVQSDHDGRIWVEDEDHSAETVAAGVASGWTVFDSAGRMVGRLLLPKAEDGEYRYSIQFGTGEVLIFHLNSKTKTGAMITAYPLVSRARMP